MMGPPAAEPPAAEPPAAEENSGRGNDENYNNDMHNYNENCIWQANERSEVKLWMYKCSK